MSSGSEFINVAIIAPRDEARSQDDDRFEFASNKFRSSFFGEIKGIGNPGDTKIISVCRVNHAHDGGAGRGKSISRGKRSHDFRDLTAGKYTRTRSVRHEVNEIPIFIEIFDQRGDLQFAYIRFSRIVATQKMATTRGCGGRMRRGKPEIRLRVARIVWG